MNTRHHYLSLLRTFALATLTAAAVTACSDDNGDPARNEPITPADGIPVAFTADINPGSDADPAAAPDTRTVLTPTDGNGFTVTWKGKNDHPDGYDVINIWAARGTTKIGPITYVPTTSDVSSALVPEYDNEKLTLTETGEWKFTAVYGATATNSARASATVSPLYQSAPGNTEHFAAGDFSVATVTQPVTAGDMPNIGLQFNHLLSALQLRVTNGTTEALTVKEIRLFAAGGEITRKKDYDVATGDWKTTGEVKDPYLKLIASNFSVLATGGASQDFHMLLFPGYGGTDMTITVITDRGEYTLTKPAPGTGFEAGKNYLTDIDIKSSGLTDKETWIEYIRNKAELIAFRERVNYGNDKYHGKTVRLVDNIDLTGETWTPIGINPNYFCGTFDGDGYHISNLTVNRSYDYAGLFGYGAGCTLRNLRVSGTVTTTASYAGGIVGYLYSSTVENCIFSGNVSGSSNVGGIAGLSYSNSQIAGCYTKGKVITTSVTAGGIVGWNYRGSSIDGCYSEAEVEAGNQRVGGIVGVNEDGGTITHCYATGSVSGKNAVGGIVGYNDNSSVTGCIALNPGITRTEGTEIGFGRIAGNNQGTFTSCAAYDGMTFTDAANQPITGTTGEDGEALTREQCLAATTYTSRGFPFADATTAGWAFDSTAPWTYLPWNPAFASFYGIGEAEYKISVSTFTGGAN